ncbi:hypothetical protein [Streptomyces sp. NPDC058657]|uniref:hypothetical protein n=1 Tax=unclassified Streptomyces TaxID=2593676 RepID=UPI003668E488
MGVPEQRGEASGEAQFFQARNDQQITQWISHVHLCGSHAEQIRAEADGLVRQLTHVVGALQEERDALKGEVRRARAEGRADALREVQSQLQDSELRLMGLRRRWEEAKQGREQAEQLLADARRAAEAYRREAEELRRKQGEGVRDGIRAGRLLQEVTDVGRSADYDRVVSQADAQLDGMRDELRKLSADMRVRLDDGADGRVVPGAVVPEAVEVVPPVPVEFEEPGVAPVTEPDDVPLVPDAPAQPTTWYGPAGVRMSLLATLLSVALVVVVAESMNVMFRDKNDTALVWMVLYSVVALPLGFFLSYFVKSFVLAMGGWNGTSDLGLKGAIHALFFCLTLAYVLLDWPVGSWTTGLARFIAVSLGPLP